MKDEISNFIAIFVLLGTALVVVVGLLEGKRRELARKDTGSGEMEELALLYLETVEKLETVGLCRLVARRKSGFNATYESLLIAPESEYWLYRRFWGRVVDEEIVELVPPYDINSTLNDVAEDIIAAKKDSQLWGEFRGHHYLVDVRGEWISVEVELTTPHDNDFDIEIDRLEDVGPNHYDHVRSHGPVRVRFDEDSRSIYEEFLEPAMSELMPRIEPASIVVHVDNIEVTVTCEAVASTAVVRFMLALAVEVARPFESNETDLESAVVW